MNIISNWLDRVKLFFSNEKITDEEKEEKKIDKNIKLEKLNNISSACVNSEDLINSKDFLKGLRIILRLTPKYNIDYFYLIFKKLGKNQELSLNEKEDLIYFIQDKKIKDTSNKVLMRLRYKSSLNLKVNSIDKYIEFNEFLQKIFSENWFNEIKHSVLKMSWIEGLQESVKDLAEEIVKKKRPIIIPDEVESIIEHRINKEEPIEKETIQVLESKIVDNIPENIKEVLSLWFKEVSISLNKKIFYQLWFRVENTFNWIKENVFENPIIENKNTVGIEEAISKQVSVNPAYWHIKKWEITEFLWWACDWEQLFTFDSLNEEANNIGARIPTIEELEAIIKEEGIGGFIRFSPGFRSDNNNRFKLYNTYVHYWTSSIDKESGENIFLSIDARKKIIKRETTKDINLWFSPCLVRDIE